MERKFQINWPAIVEEAKQRRKSQKLTQKRLAVMAGVSTPTISRFENGEKDVQLSSVMSILSVLGMVDQRQLIFSDPEEWYDKHRMSVFFNGKDGDDAVQCAISREALVDHLGDDSEASLKIFKANRERIEHEARRKYLSGQFEADGSILIRTGDL